MNRFIVSNFLIILLGVQIRAEDVELRVGQPWVLWEVSFDSDSEKEQEILLAHLKERATSDAHLKNLVFIIAVAGTKKEFYLFAKEIGERLISKHFHGFKSPLPTQINPSTKSLGVGKKTELLRKALQLPDELQRR